MANNATRGDKVEHTLLVQTINLTKRFPQVLANDRISFDVRRGEIHCLLGENGAGKTTLARCIYGFHQPDGGEIQFRGEATTIASPSDAIRLGIGMVHQHFALIDPLSVIENVIMGNEGRGALLNLDEAEKKLKSLCEVYGVDLNPKAKIWQLSVGEQQWVEILKALYIGVDLLILDEPTSVLTPQESKRLFGVLQKMKGEGLSIIFVTHKLNEVMQVSDRVTILRKGKMIDTINTGNVTKKDLARLMVGRDVIFQVEPEEISKGEPVLEIRDLHTLDDMGLEALRGVSFKLHRNEILGLAGVAGNGQKELFEVLIGVRKAESGQVIAEGENITNQTPSYVMSKGIGHIPANRIQDGLIPDLTVAENLVLGQQRNRQYLRGSLLDQEAINKFAEKSVSEYSIITPSVDHLTKFLSGGNLQKVILARELWICPQALLANQPTRGLDVGVIEYVHGRLLEKRKEGVGILLASEDLDELLNLSDRIAVIFKGQIVGIFDRADADIEEIGLLMAGIQEDVGS
jgi:simple sugar transport system ATP-binding protein